MLRAVSRAALLVAALLLAGCSDDDPGGGSSDRAAVEEQLAALYAGDHAAASDTEAAACFAGELVDRAGLDRLRDAGIVTGSGEVASELPAFDEETARLWVAAQFACTDYVEESTRAMEAQSKGRLDADRYAACLRDALGPEQLQDAVVASLTGAWDAPEVTELADAQAGCSTEAQRRR